jgi:hypothetical protein
MKPFVSETKLFISEMKPYVSETSFLELARRFQGITVADSVHALPAGNEEEIATMTTGSSSRNKYIMVAGCVSMILVTVVVATVNSWYCSLEIVGLSLYVVLSRLQSTMILYDVDYSSTYSM